MTMVWLALIVNFVCPPTWPSVRLGNVLGVALRIFLEEIKLGGRSQSICCSPLWEVFTPSCGNVDTRKRFRKRKFVWLLELNYWSLLTSDLDVPFSVLLLDDNVFHSTLTCRDFVVRLSCFLCSPVFACYSREPPNFKIVWVYFTHVPLPSVYSHILLSSFFSEGQLLIVSTIENTFKLMLQ